MQYATALNGDEAAKLAFNMSDVELTQDEADHVLPIMASYNTILESVRKELKDAEDSKPHPEAIYGR